MTRVAAYVVLILFAIILASTAPSWQARTSVRGDSVPELAVRLGGRMDRGPTSPVSITEGREIFTASCAGCHGSGNLTFGMAPLDSSPRDIYQAITWGRSLGAPDDLDCTGVPTEPAKDHPVYPVALSESERWAVSIYVHGLWLPSADITSDGSPQQETGPALYERLCLNCQRVCIIISRLLIQLYTLTTINDWEKLLIFWKPDLTMCMWFRKMVESI